MNDSNKFTEFSVKQQLALCQIGKDLIDIDKEIKNSYNQNEHLNEISHFGDRLLNLFIKFLPCVS
jgi:hypothetical protein